MKTSRSLFSLIVLSAGLAAQPAPVPDLLVEFVPLHMKFQVIRPGESFLGAVILSLSPDLVSYSPALPPLLSEFAIVGMGTSLGGIFFCSIPEHLLPPGMMIYAQGVTFDGGVFEATPVRDFVLDVTVWK